MKPKSITRVINAPINPSRSAYLNGCIKLVIAIAVIVYAIKANGQTPARETVNQSIQWVSINSNIKLHSKFGLSVDGQFRFAQYENMQHMLRVGFDYYITKQLSVVPVGYSYIWNYQYGKQPASFVNNEQRIWQQVAYKHSLSRLAISHRLRFEERFIQAHSVDPIEGVVNNGFVNKQFRVRYRALVNIPLNHAKMDPKTYYISIWDEAFMSWGKAVTYDEPDQNRIFVGPGYQITKALAFQGGFFYQALVKANGAKQENNVGFLVQMNYNVDLSKKQSPSVGR